MAHQLLPSSCYSPSRSGQALSTRLNTIIEDEVPAEVPVRPKARKPRLNTMIDDEFQKEIRVVSHPPREFQTRTLIEDDVQSDVRVLLKESNQPQDLSTKSPSEGRSVYSSDDQVTPRAFDYMNQLGSPPSSGSSRSSNWQRMMHPSEEDLYDCTDDESEPCSAQDESPSFSFRGPSVYSDSSRRDSGSSSCSGSRYPSLVIPSPHLWPHVHKSPLQHDGQPIPPTPPHKIPLSPAVLSYLARDVPAANAPPSLDGSLTSEQMAAMSVPATPDMASNDHNETQWGSPAKIYRSPEALQQTWMDEKSAIKSENATKDGVEPETPIDSSYEQQKLANVAEQFEELRRMHDYGIATDEILPQDLDGGFDHDGGEPTPRPFSNGPEMAQRTNSASYLATLNLFSAAMRRPESGELQLTIPSPDKFFNSLAPSARHTWCPSSVGPSSATAEQFYNAFSGARAATPARQRALSDVWEWNDAIVESPLATQGMIIPHEEGEEIELIHEIQNEPDAIEYDEDYDDELRRAAATNIDRTSTWLAAQTSYMAALREANPVNRVGGKIEESTPPSAHHRDDSTDTTSKKTVHFQDQPVETAQEQILKKESLYYRAFQHLTSNACPEDTFVHRLARSDALQLGRLNLPTAYGDQLTGQFHITEKPIPGSPSSETTPEQRLMSRVDRERQALEQLRLSAWNIEALKFLNGGHLLISPARNILSLAPPLNSNTLDHHNRVRCLDLGGHPAADWAWACALEFRNVKTYTVTTKDIPRVQPPIRGPRNHRHISVPHLWALPFPDAHFDVISARSLPLFLKTDKRASHHPAAVPIQVQDEYDLTLHEVMRVLKPGGYLEFALQDADIVSPAGPCAHSLSRDMAFALKERGYDSTPSRDWIGRLRQAGFGDVKRAWTVLPMSDAGDGVSQQQIYDEEDLDQTGFGSTANVAAISSMVGTLAFERWILKLAREGQGQDDEDERKILENVAAVIEEAKKMTSKTTVVGLEDGRVPVPGWRCLLGYARKGR